MRKTLITILLTLIVLINLAPSTLVQEYRNPFKLISWDTGITINEQGDGLITSPYVDSYYNYIKYSDGLPVGSKMFSLFFYNPFTLYGDDIVLRFDF